MMGESRKPSGATEQDGPRGVRFPAAILAQIKEVQAEQVNDFSGAVLYLVKRGLAEVARDQELLRKAKGGATGDGTEAPARAPRERRA